MPSTTAAPFAVDAGSKVPAGKRVYAVRDFSKHYYAYVVMTSVSPSSDDSFVDGEGFIVVRDQNDKDVVRVGSASEPNSLHFWPRGGNVVSNVLELPYGEQSLIISDDFDFDGDTDLAIWEGRQSCYGGASYEVYLRQGKRLVPSRAFSKLAQEYCGFFKVDHQQKRLETMFKSGCCWHQLTTFDVVGGAPRKIEVLTIDDSVETTERLINGKWVKRTRNPPSAR